VLRALAEPVLHHRSPDFAEVFALAQERLREVFRTENEVLVFTSSGTGAFESAVVNLLSPGERVLAVSQGEFGERWQAMAARVRLRRRPARVPLGRGSAPDDLRDALAESGARRCSSSTPRRRRASSATSSRCSRSVGRRALCPSSTRCRASAPCRSRPTRGVPTQS
jgi:hypothetical protein